MNNLYEMVRDSFIKATNGEFLSWPEEEQEEAIWSVIKRVQ